MKMNHQNTGLEIAIIGMAGRFPGAENVNQYWENIIHGIESISVFDDQQLKEVGITNESLLSNPNYIKAKGVFPGIEYFDAEFFHYTPKDASTIDPQIRVLHEEVYHALEDAGYANEQYRGSIGVFVSGANNFVWEAKTLQEATERNEYTMGTIYLNDKDFSANRVSYSLNLQGPSVVLYNACASSLYNIDAACRYILTGGCNLAVAGGTNASLPHINGYLYHEGMIYSKDGHCRPFDAEASGIVEGNGVGLMVLKKMDKAIQDGDHIYAVIKGFAVNNDGNRKVGFTAPSVEGQSETINRALQVSGLSPDQISYIEAHGTGTVLGDPIEISSLKQVFKQSQDNRCVIGSVKANIGHLNIAAGIASLIKTALALEHNIIPPSINFHCLNPNIELEGSPFRIITEPEKWEHVHCQPLRAGVNSFGIGGTNVHIILEERPEPQMSTGKRKWKLFNISAASQEGLHKLQKEYIEHLEREAGINASDLAWSLQTGPRNLARRFTLVYDSVENLLGQLKETIHKTNAAAGSEPNVYFLFPGQGTQYSGMAKELYQSEILYQQAFDRCLELLNENLRITIRRMLLCPVKGDDEKMQETGLAQLTLFVVEYSLATMLIGLGIVPGGLIGHSLGEYTAACISGAIPLETAIHLINKRGMLMEKLPAGTMLSVAANDKAVSKLLTAKMCIAASNSPLQCTVSGSNQAAGQFVESCEQNGLKVRKLHTNHAFHSPSAECIRPEFEEYLCQLQFAEPKIPYISNLTGSWMTSDHIRQPQYYSRQMTSPVLFDKGIETIMAGDEKAIFIEVGPGKSLSAFVRQITNGSAVVVNCIPHPKETMEADECLLRALGELWKHKVNINWKSYYEKEFHNRVALPLYPFAKVKYPIIVDDLSSGGEALASEQPLNILDYSAADQDCPEEELTPAQILVQESWTKLFGSKISDIDADFFEIGGDSFKMVQLLIDFSQKGLELPPDTIFKSPTIRLLAADVEREYKK